MYRLTDDDGIRACNRLETIANDIDKLNPGHYMSNMAAAYRHIAKAYFHSDLNNRKYVREMFMPVLLMAHALNMGDVARQMHSEVPR